MADPRERWNDQEEAMRLAIDRHLGTVWTALPVKILEDSEGHTCKAQSTIKAWERGKDGSMKSVDMPHFGEVPVNYSSGGGFIITHPIKKDDEGIALFASRCMDGWWDKGDVQEEPYRRRHSLSDAMYIPGIRSNPRKIGGDDRQQQNGQQRADGEKEKKKPSTNSVQIRTEDGEYYIELTSEDVNIVCVNCTITAKETVTVTCKNAKVKAEETIDVECKNLNIKASDRVNIDSPHVHMTGDLVVDGEVTGKNVHLSTHRHTQVQGGLSTSGPPQPGS